MLGKRQQLPIATDTTSIRRHKEAQTIYDIANHLPLGKDQLERANQSILLRLAVQYIKLRRVFRDTFRDARLLGFSKELFHGFVMVVDMKGTVVYASENITEQLGPQLVDVIGLPFLDIVHTDDREKLSKIHNLKSAEDLQEKVREFFPCVLRMKTNVSPTVRSQAKVQYKDVFVTFRVKQYASMLETEVDQEGGDPPPEDDTQDTSSVLAVLMCHAEAHRGIPEIIINAQFSYSTDLKHNFTGGEKIAEWLTGYKISEVIGVNCFVMKHPADVHDAKQYLKRTKILFKEGYFFVTPYRIVTSWGQWIWLESKALPILGKSGEPSGIRFCCKILGAADQHDFMPSLKSSSTSAFDGSPLTTGSTYVHSSPTSGQTYPQYVDDTTSSLHTSPQSYQDTPSSHQSSPRFYQDSPNSLQSNPQYYQDSPASLQNSPHFYQDSPSSLHSNPPYHQDTPSSQTNPQQYNQSAQYFKESPQYFSSSSESHLNSFQPSPQSVSSDELVESITPFNPALSTADKPTMCSPVWHWGPVPSDLPTAYSSVSVSNSHCISFPALPLSASVHLKVEPTDITVHGDLSCHAPPYGDTLPSWGTLHPQHLPMNTVKQQRSDGGCLFSSTHLIHNTH